MLNPLSSFYLSLQKSHCGTSPRQYVG